MIHQLKQVRKKDIHIVGYKGAWLGEILFNQLSHQHNFLIPNAFIIGADFFDAFLEQSNLKADIESHIDRINIEKADSLEYISLQIRDMINDHPFSEEMRKEILSNFKKIKSKNAAVRSTATSTYMQAASWAGELETFLNIDKKNILEAVKRAWMSYYLPRPLYYRILNQKEDKNVKIAVIIQEMIDPILSGVGYSKHPVIHDNRHILIEAIYGLGQGINYENIHPDTYLVDNYSFDILDIHINPQEEYLAPKRKGLVFKQIKTLKQFNKKLEEKQVKLIAEEVKKISQILKFDCAVEWGLVKNKIYILQIKSIN